MGKASSIGLGVALARPDVRVVVLDGDGSLLMNLGTLVTIAGAGARRTSSTSCSKATPTTPAAASRRPGEGVLDLAALAKGAGYPTAVSIEENADLDRQWADLLKSDGPTFVRLHVPSMWVTRDMPSATGGGWTAVAKALASEGAA